jgi:hypothetical protein
MAWKINEFSREFYHEKWDAIPHQTILLDCFGFDSFFNGRKKLLDFHLFRGRRRQ